MFNEQHANGHMILKTKQTNYTFTKVKVKGSYKCNLCESNTIWCKSKKRLS